MFRAVRNLTYQFRWILSGVVVVAGLMLLSGLERPNVEAAVPPPSGTAPTVTSVNVSTTSNSATISFSTDYSAWARVRYGTTAAYGSFEPAGGSFVDPGGDRSDHLFVLTNLSPSTTYHFTIDTVPPSSTSPVESTADRSFSTGSGGSGTGTLTITNISYECTGGNCRISYSTGVPANVQIKYDFSDQGNFNNYQFGVGEPAGQYTSQLRSLDITNLNLGTTYHYRMQATDESVNVFTTGDFTLTTGADSDDRTFSTGECSDGTAIGACSPSGAICEPGGNLVFRCDSVCGFSCPSGQSCSANGQCVSDPPLTGSPYQCNDAECYGSDGNFLSSSPSGKVCYRSWPRCTANTVLKVRKDRGCNLWLTCTTSLQTEPTSGQPSENICLALGACNKLGPNGQCISFLPAGQCTNDPLRFCNTDAECEAGGSCATFDPVNPNASLRDLQYITPTEISRIANLSGNVIAGLDWNIGTLGNTSNTGSARGFLPWQLMQQIGGNAKLENGDFERNPPDTEPWEAVPTSVTPDNALNIEFENVNSSHNHVLNVDPINSIPNRCSDDIADSCTTDAECGTGATCEAAQPVLFSGVATKTFDTNTSELYFAEARLKSEGKVRVRMQFGHGDYQFFTVTNSDGSTSNTFVDVDLTSAWQRVTLGPISGMSGKTRLAFVLSPGQAPASFQIDDVQVRPVLQASTSPTYITPSCRLYPKEDSPACDYIDQNGIAFQGWRGYCLEHDSVTGTCISWWPVDLIKGESDLFGSEQTAGYSDRSPLFLCVESEGVFNKPDPLLTSVTTFSPGGPDDSWATCDPNASSNFGVSLCGLPLKHYQVMTTPIFQDLSGFITDPQCENLEDFGACRANWQRGVCTCADPGPGQTFNLNSNASATDSAIHKSTIEYFRLVALRKNPRWNGLGFPDQLVIGPENESADGLQWRVSWTHTEGDVFTFWLQWGSDGFLDSYHMSMGVPTNDSNDEGGVIAVGMFALKEQCTKVVQVVEPGTQAQSFATRVSSNSYTVPDLNYQKSQDLAPFGGALQPETQGTIRSGDPQSWPVQLNAEAPDVQDLNNQQLAAPYQARAGTPYACAGDCNRVCSTLAPNAAVTSCNSDLECNGVSTTGGAITRANYDSQAAQGLLAAKGRCIGVPAAASGKGIQTFGPHDPTAVTDTVANNAYFAQERLRRLFVKSQQIWGWNGAAYQEITGGWDPPDTICPITDGVPKRPAYPQDYCAVPPNVFCGDTQLCTDGRRAAFLSSPSTALTISGGSGVATIKFNTDADPDQVPLETIRINWGDEVSTISFPYQPRNDPSRPHIISHAYRIDPGNPACSGSGSSLECRYDIKIQVQDNWGWCNDAAGTTKCQSSQTNWISTGLQVRVTR